MTLVGANWPCMRWPNLLMSTVTWANCSLLLTAPGVELLGMLSSAARDENDKETSLTHSRFKWAPIQLLVESLPMKAEVILQNKGQQEEEIPFIKNFFHKINKCLNTKQFISIHSCISTLKIHTYTHAHTEYIYCTRMVAICYTCMHVP